MIETIAFDGDDTLWHNETLFSVTQARFAQLLEPYGPFPDVSERLVATEGRNLASFGYGIKGFTLSMIETAIELTDGRIDSIERISPNASDPAASKSPPMEIVRVVYATIRWVYMKTGAEYVDSWATGQSP